MLGGLDGLAVGARDWELGSDWLLGMLREADAPVVAANLVCSGERPFPESRIVERGGRRIGVVGVTDGAVEGCEVGPLGPALKEALTSLPEVDLTVALVPATNDRELAAVVGDDTPVDVVFDARAKHSLGAPDARGSAWVFGSGSRGKQLGVMQVTWVPGATGWAPIGLADTLSERVSRTEQRLAAQQKRLESTTDESARGRIATQVAAYEGQLAKQRAELEAASSGTSGANRLENDELQLNAATPDHPETRALVDATLQAIRQLEMGSAIKPLMQPHLVKADSVEGGSPYAGSDTCAACHQGEHAQWAGTAHARAWQTLVTAQREMDSDCFSCHATGVGQEGGPAAPPEVGPFRDVQCESCHGPGRAHLSAPKEHPLVRSPGEAVCVTCHDGERDEGRFDFEQYLPHVRHGDGP